MKTSTSSDRKGRWPLLLTEIFQKLKGVLNTQIFQIQGLSMYAREEKLHRRRRLKLGGWGYAPPDFAILRHKYWNFCRWGADVPPDETSLATRSKEKRLYSQARIIENYRWQRQTCMYLIINDNTFFSTPVAKLRENVHKCLTLLPSIFMTGVHPPSPHPKFPKWQRTETSLESRRRVTNWLTFNLYKMKSHFNFSSSHSAVGEKKMECTLTGCKKKKGSLFLTEISEWNSVQSQSNLNFWGSPLF